MDGTEHAALERIESSWRARSGDASDKDYIRLKFRVRNLRDIVLLHQGDPSGTALGAADAARMAGGEPGQGHVPSSPSSRRGSRDPGSALAPRRCDGARAIWQEEAERLDAISTANLSLLACGLLAIDLGDLERANDIAARLQRRLP